jgi:hypothetical protein
MRLVDAGGPAVAHPVADGQQSFDRQLPSAATNSQSRPIADEYKRLLQGSGTPGSETGRARPPLAMRSCLGQRATASVFSERATAWPFGAHQPPRAAMIRLRLSPLTRS